MKQATGWLGISITAAALLCDRGAAAATHTRTGAVLTYWADAPNRSGGLPATGGISCSESKSQL